MDGSTENLTPTEVAKKTFGSRLRGVDPTEVSTFLDAVATRLRTAETDRDAWKAEVDRLRDEVTSLQESLVEEQTRPDEAALTEQLGQEAGRVITEARAAAADRLEEAEAEAADIIAAAEELHAERSRAADAEVERLRAAAIAEERTRLEAADDEAGTIRDRAREDAAAIRADAGVDQQAADAEAARIIREAELTRRRILEDLARRRSAARRQIEQLRAGRERLLASHEVVRRALEEISEELNISMSEARAAAETAGHSVSESTLEEIEAEIETAKLAGLLDTGPLPVVRPRAETRPAAEEPAAAEPASEPASVDEPAVATPGDDTAPEASDDGAEAEATTDEENPAEPEDQASSEPEHQASPAQERVPEPSGRGPRPDIGRAAEAGSGDDGDGPLADVVSLTAARQDVDTDRHPANRRPPKSRPSEPEPVADTLGVVPEAPVEPEIPEVAEVATLEPAPAESEAAEPPADAVEETADAVEETADAVEDTADAVEEPAEDTADEEHVDGTRADSLFARMRKTQDAALVAPEPEGGDEEAEGVDAVVSDPARLVDDVGRKLKRVLADEQSDVLSSLRAGSGGTGLTDLLGTEADHRLRYWSVTEAVLGESSASSPKAEAEVTRLVAGIRRRVEQCLVDADTDPDAAVDRLRSVYREVKTQRISEHAQIICGVVEDLNAS